MKKDAYYFPHFSNARHDRKVKRVIKDLGIEGYGIYFMLLEVLREQPDFKYPIEDIDLLADEFGTSESKLSVVVGNYDLFQVDTDNNFFSMKQVQYLQPYLERVQRAKEAASSRWSKAKELTTSDANADANALLVRMQGKERKGKEKKEKELEGRDLVWDKWFKYKKQKKQTYTEMGMKALISKYEDETDETLEAMIDQSITNNWAGLFPLREPIKPKSSSIPSTGKPYAIVVPDDF